MDKFFKKFDIAKFNIAYDKPAPEAGEPVRNAPGILKFNKLKESGPSDSSKGKGKDKNGK